MDMNLLFASFLFGIIGTGLLAYARRSGRIIAGAAGIGLMVVPFFITNLLLMLLVCSALTAMPWLIRDA